MFIQSTFQYHYLWLPLVGLIVGLGATMIGSNGGSVFPPVLILIFQIPPHIAVATSLAATIPIGLAGTLAHHHKGNIRFRTALIFMLSGFAGAITGALTIQALDPELFKMVLGTYFITLGGFFIYSVNKTKKPSASGPESSRRTRRKTILTGSAFGFLAGSATGLFGTSGTAPVLAGMFSLKLPMRIIAGTSLLVIFSNALSGLTGHLVVGQVDMTLVYLLASGSVVGSLAGPWLLNVLNLNRLDRIIQKPGKGVKYGFIALFMISGLLIILN